MGGRGVDGLPAAGAKVDCSAADLTKSGLLLILSN